MKNTDPSAYYRSLVMGVNTKVPISNGQYVKAINFENAATTPPLVSVMNDIMSFAPWYSSVHRGKGYKSRYSSEIYEQGRKIVLDYVKGDNNNDVVIFTKNTTESINMLAYKLYQQNPDQIILSTEMEHLANDLPWRDKFKTEYVKVNEKGQLCIEDLESKLIQNNGKIKLVTVTGASNVTGLINPIYTIAALAHRYGAKILVDGAQLIPHVEIDMKPYFSNEHIDYLVFSAHKMYAPFGVGVLIGPKEELQKGKPIYQGGGSVRFVCDRCIQLEDTPAKDEAGTPNVMGVKALTTAIQTLKSTGMSAIHEYENKLIHYVARELKRIPSVKLYGYDEKSKRVGVLSFNIEGMKHYMVAEILSKEAGIAVRNGLFCAHPYVIKLLGLQNAEIQYYCDNPHVALPGMVRISFGLYNNINEIDQFIKMVSKIVRNKTRFIRHYKNCTDD